MFELFVVSRSLFVARLADYLGLTNNEQRTTNYELRTTNNEQKMKLAFSTNAYLKYSFAEAVRRLAGIGYAGVEIMADVPHAWPACLLEEQKQGIRKALADNRLEIFNTNAFMMK